MQAFLEHKQTLENNPLIQEIMSKPSGKIPEGLLADELPISFPCGTDENSASLESIGSVESEESDDSDDPDLTSFI